MNRRVATIGLASLLLVSAAGCGSAGHPTTRPARKQAPLALLKRCLTKDGYAVMPESAADVGTAPRRFEFIAVWNLLNPSRVALALTFSKGTSGAEQASAWTRRTNARIGRGAVIAPVVRIGRVNVLWTAKPGALDTRAVYGCLRRQA